MCNSQCKDCQFFIQHYAFIEGTLTRIYFGHCTHGRVARKRPDAQTCGHFHPGPADTEIFADKAYLTRRLLERVLSLDPLPEIADAPDGKA